MTMLQILREGLSEDMEFHDLFLLIQPIFIELLLGPGDIFEQKAEWWERLNYLKIWSNTISENMYAIKKIPEVKKKKNLEEIKELKKMCKVVGTL